MQLERAVMNRLWKEEELRSNERRLISKRVFYVVLAGAVLFAAFVIGTNGANAGGMKEERKACEDNPDVTKMACEQFDQKTWDKHKAETDKALEGASNAMDGFDREKFYFTLGEDTYRRRSGVDLDSKNWNVRLGYQLTDNWAIEGEISKARDGHNLNNNYPSNHKFSDAGIYAKFEPIPGERFSPFLRAGIIETKVKNVQPGFDFEWTDEAGTLVQDEVCGGHGGSCAWSSSDIDLSLGLGAELEVTDKIGLRGDISWVNYSLEGGNSNNTSSEKHFKYGLSAVYRF